MPILVDYSLCDGVEGCPAVQICDGEALYFDAATRRVEYEIDRCRNCGTCANYCGPSAVLYVPTHDEWEEIRGLMP